MNTKQNTDNNTTEPSMAFWRNVAQLAVHPPRAVTRLMTSPKPILLSLLFIACTLTLTLILLPSMMSGTDDLLQSSSLVEHLTPEEYSAMTQLTPVRRAFASILITFFSFWTVAFQGFFLYLFFALARYPGLYREYITAVLAISFYDTILPMFLSLLLPFIPQSALNLSFLPGLPPVLAAFLQPNDIFTLLSLIFLGIGISGYAKRPLITSWLILALYLLARTLFFGSINLFFY